MIESEDLVYHEKHGYGFILKANNLQGMHKVKFYGRLSPLFVKEEFLTLITDMDMLPFRLVSGMYLGA